MATVKEIIQGVIAHTRATPPTIRWNRQVCGNQDRLDDHCFDCNPTTNGREWYGMYKLDPPQIIDNTFVAKLYVAGQHVNTITDTSTNNVVDTNDSTLNLTIADTTAPIKLLRATLDKSEGTLQLKWNGSRPAHRICLTYQFAKRDCDPGDLGVVYYTGDTPFEAKPQYDWGLSVAFTKKNDKSQIKSKKMLLYANRLPYYTLEPEAGSSEAKDLDDLFKTIELGYLENFKYFLNGQSQPDDSLTGDEILS